MLFLTSVAWLNCRIWNHGLLESEMRMEIRCMFLGRSRVSTMQIKASLFIIERELPSIKGIFASGLEERPEHPVGSSWLQDGMNDEGTLLNVSIRSFQYPHSMCPLLTLLRSMTRETEPTLECSENGASSWGLIHIHVGI